MNNVDLNGQNRDSRDDWGQHFGVVRLPRLYCEFIQHGDFVIDGGANAGMHTIPLANRVGRNGKVTAIEPQAECIADLRGWLLKERLVARVDICEGVLSDKSGTEKYGSTQATTQ